MAKMFAVQQPGQYAQDDRGVLTWCWITVA
jgi:hypothetical protein